MAYEWCSVICENYTGLADGNKLLFLSLEIGFRHLDYRNPQMEARITHTELHNRMVDIVFEGGNDEVVADLLHAWTSYPPGPSLGKCARHLVGLRPTSQRLRRLVIRSIELIDPQEFEAVAEDFLRLLNHLHVAVGDMDGGGPWGNLLTCIIQHPEGVLHLSHPYWELLVELFFSGSLLQREGITWSQDIMENLEEGQEWDKLESWMCLVWMAWPPEGGETTERDLGHVTLSLFRQRPGAVQKLVLWVKRWNKKCHQDVPESFRWICDLARLKLHGKFDHKSPLIITSVLQVSCGFLSRFRPASSTDEESEEPARSTQPPPSPSPGKNAV